MPYSNLPGNDSVKAYLTRIVEKGMVGHSFLFGGPASANKPTFARIFAAQIIGTNPEKLATGNHPDLHILRPEGKASLHSIESLREFTHEVFLPPNESDRKVFIIEEAERMAPTSANALLKTFEEPSPDTVIILITDHPARLLPTIRSRCRAIHFAGEATSSTDETLLHLLTHGVARYGDLQSATRDIQLHIEKEIDAELESYQETLKDRNLTAAHKGALEKELDGERAHRLQRAGESLLTTILHWYRDRHLLRLDETSSYLFHSQEQLSQAKPPLPPLEHVEQTVASGSLALQRSYALSLALEGALLKLAIV